MCVFPFEALSFVDDHPLRCGAHCLDRLPCLWGSLRGESNLARFRVNCVGQAKNSKCAPDLSPLRPKVCLFDVEFTREKVSLRIYSSQEMMFVNNVHMMDIYNTFR